jgi:hypothetical protein
MRVINRMYSIKPTGMDEAFGCLWPDGAPILFFEPEVHKVAYRDIQGVDYVIAYTEGQIIDQVEEHGMFRPYIPMFVSGPYSLPTKSCLPIPPRIE